MIEEKNLTRAGTLKLHKTDLTFHLIVNKLDSAKVTFLSLNRLSRGGNEEKGLNTNAGEEG